MAVPLLEFKDDRELLNKRALKKGEAGLKEYWAQKNQRSIDGIATHILDKNI